MQLNKRKNELTVTNIHFNVFRYHNFCRSAKGKMEKKIKTLLERTIAEASNFIPYKNALKIAPDDDVEKLSRLNK